MQKKRTLVFVLLLAIISLLIVFFTWVIPLINKEESQSEIDDSHQSSQDEFNEDSLNNDGNQENDAVDNEPEVVLIEDEGDLEIIIPDDQDSDGF